MSQKQIRAVRDEEPPILALDPKKPKPQGKIRPLGPRKPDSKNGKHCPRCGKDPQHDWNQGKCMYRPGIHTLLLWEARPLVSSVQSPPSCTQGWHQLRWRFIYRGATHPYDSACRYHTRWQKDHKIQRGKQTNQVQNWHGCPLQHTYPFWQPEDPTRGRTQKINKTPSYLLQSSD